MGEPLSGNHAGDVPLVFTERLYEEARRLELPVIEVDITMTKDDLAERLTEALRL